MQKSKVDDILNEKGIKLLGVGDYATGNHLRR